MAALDHNITSIETLLSIVLAVLVGFVSSLVLEQGYYEDLGLFFFCAVTASCQYSLIKSVQVWNQLKNSTFIRVLRFLFFPFSAWQCKSNSRDKSHSDLQPSHLLCFMLLLCHGPGRSVQVLILSQPCVILWCFISFRKSTGFRQRRFLPIHTLLPSHFCPRIVASNQHIPHVYIWTSKSFSKI
jgi:hypothetical protein